MTQANNPESLFYLGCVYCGSGVWGSINGKCQTVRAIDVLNSPADMPDFSDLIQPMVIRPTF